MDTETKNKEVKIEESPAKTGVSNLVKETAPTKTGAPASRPGFRSPRPAGNFGNRGFGERSKNPRKSFSGRGERVKPEFDQKILNIRRVTRVTKGGKRLSFSVAIVAGNKKGSIGVGTGKAGDTSVAIDKALRNAKKNIINLALTKTMSIPFDVCAKYCSGTVFISPAPGRGVSAGSAVRSVLDLAGIADVTAKIISPSKNKLNIARATVEALRVFGKKGNTQTTNAKIPAESSLNIKTEIKREIKK